MAIFRGLLFLTAAVGALGVGLFAGAAIAQPAFMELVPWVSLP
jgi:hypothetical protein